MDRKKIIKAITANYQRLQLHIDTTFEDYLAEELDNADKIHRGLSQLEQDLAGAEKRHKRELLEIRQNYKELFNSCQHHSKTRHSDPSGGSDSFTECDICGKEL